MKRFLKPISFVILLVVMAFAVAACGGNDNGGTTPTPTPPAPTTGVGTTAQPTPPPAPAEVIHLTMGWWGSAFRHDITNEVISLWNANNPGIQMRGYPLGGDGYWLALDTRVASNTVWDLFQLGSNYPQYRTHIVPLNDFIERGIIDISNTTQDFITITTAVNGDVVGMSNGVNAWGFAYDATAFDRAGVPRPTSAWTWADFEHAVVTINEELGIWGMGRITNDAIMMTQYLLQMGIDFYSEDPRQLGFSDPSVLESYFRMRQRMVQSGAMPNPGEAMAITDVEGDPLVFGNSAMAYLASNQFLALARAAMAYDDSRGVPHRELSMVVMPTHPSSGVAPEVVSSQMFSVSTSS
jgi:multiple sugar transport system substrate-binding protein